METRGRRYHPHMARPERIRAAEEDVVQVIEITQALQAGAQLWYGSYTRGHGGGKGIGIEKGGREVREEAVREGRKEDGRKEGKKAKVALFDDKIEV